MYTATITAKEANFERKQVIISASISDGSKTFEEKFIFNLGVTKSAVEFEINRYLRILSETDSLLNSVQEGPVTVVATEPTVEDTTKGLWFRDFNRLKSVQELITLGVLTGNETQVVNLRAKVKNGFKAAYIADM